MPDYKAPLRDLRFVYYELFSAGELVRLPGFEEATPDVVMAIAEEMGRFASEVLRPINASGDEEGCKFESGAVKTATGFKEAYAKYREGGWPGLEAPPAYGGQGLPYFLGTMLTEITCSANLAFSMMAALTLGAIDAMRHSATEELKQKFLPKLIDGVWSATMCLTEPQAGTDLGLVRMRAEPNADGSYRLTGGKIFISAGDHDMTENIVHLVLARLPGAPPGIKGISLFVIPKLREENGKLVPNGVTCPSIEHKMGIKASATCSIDFDGSTGWLVGEPNKGMKGMFIFMNGARLHVGAQGLALSEAAYQGAVKFARERLQGRALNGAKHPELEADPIVVHPDVRRMLLTIRAFTEAARALSAWISIEIDHAEHDPDKARAEAGDDMASLLTPIVKAFQTDLGFEMTNLALQVCGGYGYIREYGMEQYVRDCRITQIYEGANGIQALDLVGRKMSAHMGRYLRHFFHPAQAFFEAEAGVPAMQEFIEPAAKAFERLQRATGWLAQEAMKNPDEAGAAATDYLHLFGHVLFAYLWARMAKVALAKKDQATGEEKAFYEAKLATARFYMARMLPRHNTHFSNLMAGSKTLVEFPEAAF